MSDREPVAEWTPGYVQAARAEADRTRDVAVDPALVAAVRELTAEVRALRHQVVGDGLPESGWLADISDMIRKAGLSGQ